MTGRQRFRETMRYGTPDRVPYFEEGLRDGVLERWHSEGLSADVDLQTMFNFDRRERIELNLGPLPGIKSAPLTPPDLAALRGQLDPDDPRRRPSDWEQRVQAWRKRDHILELCLHRGFFLTMQVGEWISFEPAIYLLHDEPAFVHEVLQLHGELAAHLVEQVLGEVEVDFVSFSEPIGGNDRPLLSPDTYREFVLDSYRPALGVVRAHGVQSVVFMTYANARVLLPDVVEAGFNCLWAMETEAQAMDYLDIRREFGRDLRLIGGIDLDTLLADAGSIDSEMERKVPPLLEQGGYIPLADGRVRESVPWAYYLHYRRLLERMATQPGAGC